MVVDEGENLRVCGYNASFPDPSRPTVLTIGVAHNSSRISKMVLPTVNLGPPEKNRTVHRAW